MIQKQEIEENMRNMLPYADHNEIERVVLYAYRLQESAFKASTITLPIQELKEPVAAIKAAKKAKA